MPAKIIRFELKPSPCPYCGSSATGATGVMPSLGSPIMYFTFCLDCKARGPLKEYPKDAIAAWNGTRI